MNRIRTFMRLPMADKCLFLLAVVMMALAAAIIRLIPIVRIAPHLGTPLGPVGFAPIVSAQDHNRAIRLRDSIGRAANILPFRRDCYPQALAAVLLCRMMSVPVAMHLGVKLSDEGAMEAHAWSLSGRVGITGRAGSAGYTPVACFFSV
jgi:Transglutaminase-like superfamily